jgi:hypothetical protein
MPCGVKSIKMCAASFAVGVFNGDKTIKEGDYGEQV